MPKYEAFAEVVDGQLVVLSRRNETLPSCRKTARTPVPTLAKRAPAACWTKRKRDQINAAVGATSIRYTRAKVTLRGLSPQAKRIEIDPRHLEVEGPAVAADPCPR